MLLGTPPKKLSARQFASIQSGNLWLKLAMAKV